MKKSTFRLEYIRPFLIILLFSACFLLKGQRFREDLPASTRKIYFSHLTRENGLPSDFVMHAIQDFRGYVWIATDNGLARFDGKNMTVFQSHNGKSNTIVDNYVIILKESRDSMLWIGTRNGISIYDPFTGMFRNFPYDKKGSGTFPGRFVRSFFEDKDGSMWITTNDGLIFSAGGSRTFVFIKINWIGHGRNLESELNYLTSIVADPGDDSKLFIGTAAGILHFDKLHKVVVADYPKVINDRTAVFDLYIDDNRYLWSCGWFTGLNCYDLRTGKWREFPCDEKNPVTIISIFPKGRDEFWLSTIGKGLGVFNRKDGSCRFIRHDSIDPHSIITDDINHVSLFNEKKDLWILGPGGISIENRKIFSFGLDKPPFVFTALTDFISDNTGDLLYAGAYECDGLFVLNKQTGKWSIIREVKPGKKSSLLVTTFYRDRKGVLWLATNKNLMFLDTIANKIRQFKTTDGVPLQLHDSLICRLYEDSGGNLWVGTRNDGVIKIDSSRTKTRYYKHSGSDPNSLAKGTHFRAFAEDKFNRVWASNLEGVSVYDPGTDRFLNFFMDTLRLHGLGNKSAYNIENDTLGRMWMTIDGLGLLRVEINDNRSLNLKLFETAQGLDASSISTIRRDAEGDLWINNVSLIHFNPYAEVFKLFDTQSGLHNMLGMGQKIYIDPEMNILIPEEGGYEVINKYSIEPAKGIRNLIIEDIEINGSRTNLGYERAGIHRFNLKASQNNITFFFTAICFNDVSGIKYMYKLEGYDHDWYLSENSREARYTHLPPGQFEFMFKVLNRDGLIKQENHLLLNISPFFWQTWWFVCSMIFLVLSLAYISYHLRIRQLLRLERLRMRIASDLHDDVGSTLSSISILSEMVSQKATDAQSLKMLRTIGDSSSQMMEKLDDIVWVVNPSNDKFHDLGLRLSEYANPLCESKNIEISIQLPEELIVTRLTMEIRRNVYLIAKEAINNAVKYAECTQIVLKFSMIHGELLMEISDDGNGFDPESPTSRNGLQNMRLRAKQIKADISFFSSLLKGTRIILRVKLHTRLSNTV